MQNKKIFFNWIAICKSMIVLRFFKDLQTLFLVNMIQPLYKRIDFSCKSVPNGNSNQQIDESDLSQVAHISAMHNITLGTASKWF